MFCTYCGFQMADSAMFCGNCGKPLHTGTVVISAPAREATAPASEATAPVDSIVNEQKIDDPNSLKILEADDVGEPGNNKVWIWVVLVAALVLIAGGILLWYAFKSFSASEVNQTIKSKADEDFSFSFHLGDGISPDNHSKDESKGKASEGKASKGNASEGKASKEKASEEKATDIDEYKKDLVLPDSSNDVFIKLPISEVPSNVEDRLDDIDSDYNKIQWDDRFIIDGESDVVVSTKSFAQDDYSYVFLGLTNMKSEPASIFINGRAVDDDGEVVSEICAFSPIVGSEDTYLYCLWLPLNTNPDLNFQWDELKIYQNSMNQPARWDYDSELVKSDFGNMAVTVQIKNKDIKKANIGAIHVICVDKNQNIVAVAETYLIDNLPANEELEEKIELYISEEESKKIDDILIFCNPVIEEHY